jgi:hypothetical protein
MADMVVRAGGAQPANIDIRTISGRVAGEDLVGGDLVYLDTATKTFKKGTNTTGVDGVVCEPSVLNGKAVTVCYDGHFAGYALTDGDALYASANAGKLANVVPGSGYTTKIGKAISATVVRFFFPPR